MSLLDFFGPRRQRSAARKSSSSCVPFRPRIEALEERECPSVTAPTGLQLTAISPTQVKLTWNNVPNELGFRIYEWNGTASSLVTTVGENVTTSTVGLLSPLHQYYFSVMAFDQSTTASSAWLSVTTLPDTIAAPGNVKVVASSLNTVTLAWNVATGATGYRIFQAIGSQWVLIASISASHTSYLVTGLTPGMPYYFQVQAFNVTNYATSPTVTGTTVAQGLTAPGNLKIQVVNSNMLQLNWNDSSGEAGYRVYRWDGVAPLTTLVTTLPANTTSYQDANLPAGKTFWYYVSATTTMAQLQAPSHFTITQYDSTTALLTWNPSAGAAGYNVLEWTGYGWVVLLTLPQGTTQVRVGSLASLGYHQTYWFVIKAFTAGSSQVAYTAPVFINM
jgi:large repetitive protein